MASGSGIQFSPYSSTLANNVTTKQPSLSSFELHTVGHFSIFHAVCSPHTDRLRRPWVIYSILKGMFCI